MTVWFRRESLARWHSLRLCESCSRQFRAWHATAGHSFRTRRRDFKYASRAKVLVARGIEQRKLYADDPLRCAIGALDEVKRPNLQARRLRAEVERFTDACAHRNGPPVGGIRRPVESERRIDIDIPATVEVVANLGLEIGLINAAAIAIARKGHQLVRKNGVEPGPVGINQRRG